MDSGTGDRRGRSRSQSRSPSLLDPPCRRVAPRPPLILPPEHLRPALAAWPPLHSRQGPAVGTHPEQKTDNANVGLGPPIATPLSELRAENEALKSKVGQLQEDLSNLMAAHAELAAITAALHKFVTDTSRSTNNLRKEYTATLHKLKLLRDQDTSGAPPEQTPRMPRGNDDGQGAT